MANVAFLCGDFIEHVTASYIPKPNVPPATSVEFIATFDPVAKGVIYLGKGWEVADALEACQEQIECATFFACGNDDRLVGLSAKHGINVIVVDLNPFDAHTRITRAVNRYRDWHVTLLEVGNETQSIQRLLQTGSNVCGGSLVLLNKANQVVYSAVNEQDRSCRLISEVMATGQLSAETLEQISIAERASAKPMGSKLPGVESHVFFRHAVVRNSEPFYTVLLVLPSAVALFDGETFLKLLCHTIDAMTSSEGGRYWAGEDFKSFVDQLISNERLTSEEINQRLMTLPVVPDKFQSFIVIDFDTPDAIPDPIAYFISQAEAIFPNCNACVYNNSVVLLYGQPDRFHWRTGHTFDIERFSTLLQQYHASASISTPSSKLDTMRANLILTMQVLALGRKLRYKPQEVVFFNDDYAEYVTLDLCYPMFKNRFGSDDLISLTHPDPINLWRYDKNNNDNLLDVLYYYCLCGPSIEKTAKMVYMHRNTVAAKLKKIEQIVVDDITDGQVRHRIVFSYRIMRYLDRCTPYPLAQRLPSKTSRL